ncbi:hypothetical protein C6P43_004122 [Kluyveromyces marxianus]|nr:hypothetical protein C6P43_004122 [Kluyveromyces marxianus]
MIDNANNPFDLLGNDVEEPTVVSPPKEIVKKNTSSKKADVPPPSADPSKARHNKPKAVGNEAAIKDKNAGRSNNRNKDAPASTKPKRENRRATDRQNRSGKVDTSKKVKQGWGDDEKELEQEQAAIADAAAELAEDAEEQPADNKKSLKEYLEEMKANSLDTPAPKKEVEFEGTPLEAKEKEVFAPATKVKKVKSKQLKTKQFLDFDVTFSDSLPKPRADRNTRGKRDSKKPNQKQQQGSKGPAVTHFPSLA